MSLALFLARRIYRDSDAGKQVSRPAVLIALIGVAIGLAVMIITVSVIVGFKNEVRGKVIGFGADIQITNSDAARSYETRPVVVNDSVISILSEYPEVKHVQRYSTKPGMVKTAEDFQGMVLKGIGPEFDPAFFREHLVEGELPQFSDTASSNRVVISKALATKLRLKLGDKIDTYYIQDDIRARRLQIVGIYQTNFSELAGVDVRLMLPLRADNRLTHLGSCSYLADVLQAGVKVYFYKIGFLHSKLMVSDDELTTVGSTNVDFRSFEHNFEVNAFIYDTETALQMREIFLQDQRECVQVFLKNWVKRPWWRKAAESVVRLMAPLL